MSLRSRLDRLSRQLCWGGLWDGATLEDVRDLPADADHEAAKDRLMQRGRDAGFTPAEMARLQAELARRLGRSSCVT